MDEPVMLVLIGYLTIFLCVFGGFALAGGHLAAVFQPVELLIIGGAAMGAFLAANPGTVLKAVMKELPAAFKGQKNHSTAIHTIITTLICHA